MGTTAEGRPGHPFPWNATDPSRHSFGSVAREESVAQRGQVRQSWINEMGFFDSFTAFLASLRPARV